jgi:hypothetical protein
MHTHAPNKLKLLSAHQKADGSCFLKQERSADGGIHTRDNSNARSILQNTKKDTQANGNADIQCSAPP